MAREPLGKRWGPVAFVIWVLGAGVLAFGITRAFVGQGKRGPEPGAGGAQVQKEAPSSARMQPQGTSGSVTKTKQQEVTKPKQQEVARFVVCIDPGHPSEVSDGTEVLNGLREVDVNWAVSLLVKDELVRNGVVVIMTKSSKDEKVTNARRAEIANQAKANLMVRIHADSGGGTGFTVYYPRKEGEAQGRTGPSLAVIQASGKYAQVFHAEMARVLAGKLKDNGIRGDEQSFVGSKQGAFTGSIFSEVPVLLVEMCFLDSKKDADWIKQEANKRLMAQAIASGIQACRAVR